MSRLSVDHLLQSFSIAGCQVAPQALPDDHILFWVHSGRAEVMVGSAEHHVATTGQAVWIPAGTHHSVEVASDSVALPIFLTAESGQEVSRAPTTVAIPSDLRDRLLHHFALGVSPLLREHNAGLIDLVNFVCTAEATTLPLPASSGARDVASELLASPTKNLTVEHWARQTKRSASTLRRQFLAETGIPFHIWRTRSRLWAATSYLPSGQPLDWIAHRVGFATVSGFSRAFQAEFAMSPRAYGNRVRSGLAVPTINVVDRAVPAITSPPSVSEFSIVYWMFKGTARMNVRSQTWNLTKGDAIWVPAGELNNADIDPGSIMLPLAFRWNDGDAVLKDVAVVHFPENFDRLLLHIATAIHTQVRPRGYDIYRMMFALESHITGGPGSTPATVAARTIIAAVTEEPTTHLTLAQWSQVLGVEAGTIGAALRSETGMPLYQWLSSVRMSAAQHYLQSDMPIATIADRVGYSHHSAFTRAFTRTHGHTPRQARQLSNEFSS